MVKSANKESYNKIFSKLKEHHKWFENSIPLIASENVPSPAVREAIISDFGNRYAEGWPGERVYAGCVYIDDVEFECMKLAKKLYKAKFADVRPISGVVANLAVYSAFTNPGDVMLAPSIPAGGHISHGKKEHSGTAGLVHGLEIEFYPFDAEEMTIDVDKTRQKVEELKKATFPGLTSSHHIHHMAGKAVAFAEALEFGKDYANQIIKNAKVFAEALSNAGFKVLGESRGFTESHQVAVNVLDYSDGGKVEADLEKANIIVNRQLIPGDIKAGRNYFHPGGIRLGVSEITRLGMKQSEMKEIASFIKKVIIEKKNPKKLTYNVKSFRKNYQKVHYCFDKKLGAYE